MAAVLRHGNFETIEDLGSQGEWPTHLELLDWLAAESVQPTWQADGTHAWDVRHLLRTIVMSHNYRQASLSNQQLDERDPDDRLLARQRPFRVDAEVVHDNASLRFSQIGKMQFRARQHWRTGSTDSWDYQSFIGIHGHRRK